MPIKMFLIIFGSVFIAELGDKTQLATMCYAADERCSPLGVFLAAALALVASSLLAVIVGSQLDRFISPQNLRILSGVVFVIIGAWFVYGGLKG
jgi:putative Ca2+/H+ antiporter (TMEM165/GDT1 family)